SFSSLRSSRLTRSISRLNSSRLLCMVTPCQYLLFSNNNQCPWFCQANTVHAYTGTGGEEPQLSPVIAKPVRPEFFYSSGQRVYRAGSASGASRGRGAILRPLSLLL